MATTPAGVAYPLLTDTPNGPAQMLALATSIDQKVIPAFASAAARTAAIASPGTGQITWRADALFGLNLEKWNGSAWVPILAGDTGWTTATLGNSWVSFDGNTTYSFPQYRLMNGKVELAGAIKSGTTATTIFTLPTGYRPLKQRTFGCQGSGAALNGSARVDITAAGLVQVAIYGTGGSNAGVSLDGIHFVAEQ